MSFMVVAVNSVALAWPFVHKVLSGKLADYYDMTMEVYYWCCSNYARWCGSKEHRAQIAAADAKIKKKKQKEKQMAKEAAAPHTPNRMLNWAYIEQYEDARYIAVCGRAHI